MNRAKLAESGKFAGRASSEGWERRQTTSSNGTRNHPIFRLPAVIVLADLRFQRRGAFTAATLGFFKA
jgi:hypothetical protein